MAQQAGLEISRLASGESRLSSPTASSPQVRQKILDFTRKSLQVAHWLGLDAYLFVSGSVDVFFAPYAEVV